MKEFQRRLRIHRINYAIYMTAMLLLGMVGAIGAFLGVLSMYGGEVLGVILSCKEDGLRAVAAPFPTELLLLILGAALGIFLATTRKKLPIELCCPTCNARLDELCMQLDHCPGCCTCLLPEVPVQQLAR